MTIPLRIIPRLDIKGPNLVKGVHLEGLRVLGKPESFARNYYENGADELIYQDVVASLYERNSLHDIITRTAREIFIPLTVGGGLRSIKDIETVLRAGADKVSINTAAHENSRLISEAAFIFGKSTIAVSIEAVRQSDGKYEAFTDNGRNRTGKDVVKWAIEVENLGAGEILLTSVDKEGTGDGFDIDLIREVYNKISIPLVIHGGASKTEHFLKLLKEVNVSGVSIASMFHYSNLKDKNKFCEFAEEGNTEFLKNRKKNYKNSNMSIKDLKRSLIKNKISCRDI